MEAASNSSSAQLESFVAFLITFVLGLVLLKLAFDFVKATWATGVALVFSRCDANVCGDFLRCDPRERGE